MSSFVAVVFKQKQVDMHLKNNKGIFRNQILILNASRVLAAMRFKRLLNGVVAIQQIIETWTEMLHKSNRWIEKIDTNLPFCCWLYK